MRNLKRALSLALASVMLLGMMVVGTSAAFTDAGDIQNKEAAEVTAALGIFSGYGDGSFGPENPVNRAEMATLIVKMLKGADFNADPYKNITMFPDIPADMDWAKGYINYAANYGVLAGYGDGTFKPEKTVSTAEAVTMIINALKVDAGEGTWPNTVMTKAVDMKLFGDLVLATNEPLTRDDLAVLLVEGLLYEEVGNAKFMIEITSGNDDDELLEEIGEEVFTSRANAHAYVANLVTNKVLVDPEYTVVGIPADNTLNAKFALTRTLAADGGVDEYGRKSTVYTAALVEDFDLAPIVTVEPYAVFEGKVEADEVEDALSKINAISNGTGVTSALGSSNRYYYIDGSENRWGFGITSSVGEDTDKYIDVGATKMSTAEFIASRSNENSVIEVYAEIPAGKTKLCINKVIITNVYAEVVKKTSSSATYADKNGISGGDTLATIAKNTTYIDNNDIVAKKVTGVAKGDVVLYTVANGVVKTYEKADSFTGKLSSYNSAEDEFVIAGDDYVISASAVAGFDADDFIGKLGKDHVYFVDANGQLIYAAATEEVEETVTIPTDYAIVLDSNVAIEEEAAAWLGETTYYVQAQIQVMLADGTKKVYDLPVTEKSGKFTVKVNNSTDGKTETKVTLLDTTADNFELTEEVIAAANKKLADALSADVYTYTVSGANITLVSALAALTGEEDEDTVAVIYTDASVSKSNPVVAEDDDYTVLANNTTKFLLKKSKNVVTKTGLAALEDTTIASGKLVIVNVDYASAGNTNIAAIVFAVDTAFVADEDPVVNTENKVYVDGTYSVSVDSDGAKVYTYIGVDEEGATVTLTGVSSIAKGIYEYNTDNEILDEDQLGTSATIGTIAGSTVDFGGTYLIVDAETVIYNVEAGKADTLTKGDKVFYIKAADNTVDVVFIWDAK